MIYIKILLIVKSFFNFFTLLKKKKVFYTATNTCKQIRFIVDTYLCLFLAQHLTYKSLFNTDQNTCIYFFKVSRKKTLAVKQKHITYLYICTYVLQFSILKPLKYTEKLVDLFNIYTCSILQIYYKNFQELGTVGSQLVSLPVVSCFYFCRTML